MNIHNFSEFQKEIEERKFKHLKTKFDFYSIKIITPFYFDDVLVQLFLWFVSFLFLFDSSVLIPSILFFGASWYFFYINFIGVGICKIDFNSKTVAFKNRIFLFNLIRKIFGIKTEINFSDIKEISCKEGSFLRRYDVSGSDSRYHLFIETYNDPAAIITQFKKEKDAADLVAIIKKFVLKKEKIIV